MENQTRCMSIKQAKLIVNAHKHNLLIYFATTDMFMLNNMKKQEISQRERESALVPVTV